jgi:hypothetical protein
MEWLDEEVYNPGISVFKGMKLDLSTDLRGDKQAELKVNVQVQ